MPSTSPAVDVSLSVVTSDGLVAAPPVEPVVAATGGPTGSVGTALIAGALAVLLVTIGIYALFQLFVLADR